MESGELRIRHRVLVVLAWIVLAVGVFLFWKTDRVNVPTWEITLGVGAYLLGFASLLYLGSCEYRLTSEGIFYHQPFFPARQCRWEDVLQAGVLIGPGKTPTPLLVITAKGGKKREENEGYWKWWRKNQATSVELDYNTRTLAFVQRYYGPLDFDEWKKPIPY